MKAGIYTRYWNTAGGGEVYAGMIARALAERHEVWLVSETEIDRDVLESRLALGLDDLPALVVGEVSDDEFAITMSSFDLFVNCTHGSSRPGAATNNIYVVHFPSHGDYANRASSMTRAIARRTYRGLGVEFAGGFHEPESAHGRTWRWTDESASMRVQARVPARLTFFVRDDARPASAPTAVRVTSPHHEVRLDAGFGAREVTLDLPASSSPVSVSIESEGFVPAAVGTQPSDHRRLGVQIENVRVEPMTLFARAARRLVGIHSTPLEPTFLRGYQLLIANSAYTATWTRRAWGRRSAVVHPAVRARSPLEKDLTILSVGRFFAPDRGHCKRQLEMVRAFKAVHRSAPEWRLHLAGGCSDADRPYLEEVLAEAEGYPIDVHVGATSDALDDLFGRASIYWHAAGLGEDPDRHPDLFEHFGISVVEAMSAGAAPIVLSAGGPAESVRHRREGLHFDTEDGLVAATLRLIADPRTRARYGRASKRRARDFAYDAFRRRLFDAVASVTA